MFTEHIHLHQIVKDPVYVSFDLNNISIRHHVERKVRKHRHKKYEMNEKMKRSPDERHTQTNGSLIEKF